MTRVDRGEEHEGGKKESMRVGSLYVHVYIHVCLCTCVLACEYADLCSSYNIILFPESYMNCAQDGEGVEQDPHGMSSVSCTLVLHHWP